jgi:signal peptidase II
MTQPRSSRAITACLVALALFTVADLWSKAWAENRLSHESSAAAGVAACTPDEHGHYYMQRTRGEQIVLVEGFLELRYAENCGAAFGLLDESPRWVRAGVFMTAGALAVAFLMMMFVRGSGGTYFAWSVPLVVSGALGNMVDRLRLGYVIDFIHFHIHQSFEWPTFNVADSTITVGVALLLLDGLRKPALAAKPADAPPQQAGAEKA